MKTYGTVVCTEKRYSHETTVYDTMNYIAQVIYLRFAVLWIDVSENVNFKTFIYDKYLYAYPTRLHIHT